MRERRHDETHARQLRQASGQAMRVAGRGGERALAVTAHAAIGFGFVGIGFLLSLLISGVIWLIGRRSPYVEAHADRAGRYQLFILLANILIVALWAIGLGLFLYLGGFAGWAVAGWRALAWGILGFLLAVAIPPFVIWYFGSIGYGLYAALRVLAGDDFHYPPPPWRRRSRRLDQPLRWER